MPSRRDRSGKGRAMPPGTAAEHTEAKLGPTRRHHRPGQPSPQHMAIDLSDNAGGVSGTDSAEAYLGKATGGD